MKEKALSFFFTNFHETWDSDALWKMFCRLTWVVIEGIPILGRNLAAVKAIAGRFGHLLEVGRLILMFISSPQSKL
nr:nucleotide-binding alpha-beta plait domain-containing protein [Tanacetum cinerariifolium]